MSRQLTYTRGFVDRAASDGDLIRFVGATEGTKRDGIELRMDGADLQRYRQNPVFLHGHNHRSLPIGRSERTEVDGKQLEFDIQFDRKDEFAASIERKYRDGYLNAVSIGFVVDEWEDEKSNVFTGGVATSWELFELSSVTLPMDKDALKQTWGLDVDEALLESVRGLLDRLDTDAIAQLRTLLDSVGRGQVPDSGGTGQGGPEPGEQEHASARPRLAAARRRLRLLGE